MRKLVGALGVEAYILPLPAKTYPHLFAPASLVGARDHGGAQNFTFGLDLLLDGIEQLVIRG